DHTRAGRGGDPHRPLHVLDAAGVHHSQRTSGGAVSAAVGAGALQGLGRRVDDVAELVLELLQRVHASARRPAMTPATTATTAKAMPTQVCPSDHQASVTAA